MLAIGTGISNNKAKGHLLASYNYAATLCVKRRRTYVCEKEKDINHRLKLVSKTVLGVGL